MSGGTVGTEPVAGPEPIPGTGAATSGRRRTRSGAYGRVLREPVLRRVLPGLLVSALGDGMSLVAVAWLAVRIAPPDQAGTWTGLAVAAYSLPATLGAVALGRLVRGLSGARLVVLDAGLRALALGTIAVLAIGGALAPAGYVALLAGSSLLHAWGSAGTYTLIAERLPVEDRVAGNALLSVFTQAAVVVGPALAGAVAALVGPGWVIGADAVSFAILGAVCWSAGGRRAGTAAAPAGAAAGGWRIIAGQRRLLGLVAVTCVFFFLYGPVDVALPIHVANELHGSPSLLGLYSAVFGVGAVLGGLTADLLQHRPLWPVVIGIVIGWGAALLPVGLTDTVWPGLVGFALGGLVYGPFTAVCTALFQRASPPYALSRVLATRTALTVPSVALGTLLGGPIVTALGGRHTLLLSGLLTIAFGVLAGGVVVLSRQ